MTTEFCSDALTNWAITPWVQLALRANFVQLLLFHYFVHCSRVLLATAFANRHIRFKRTLAQIITLTAEWINTHGIHHWMIFRSSYRKVHCVKLPKIPWYFCQDIPRFEQVSWKIREASLPGSTKKSIEILSRFGLLISGNIRGSYILGFSRGIFQYLLDIAIDIQAKYRKYHWYTSVYAPDFILDFL